jgi:alpha/beta superfamily hydrolase
MNDSSHKLHVYCIPGLGVNKQLFKYLKLNNCKVMHIKWLAPVKDEKLPEYAMRLAQQIDTSKPFVLIGVSFGGMCSIEIAKHLSPVKTFLISSSKVRSELPKSLRFLSFLPGHQLFSDNIFLKGARIVKNKLGVTEEMEQDFEKMLTPPPDGYFSKAVDMIVNWQNEEYPSTVFHIHGNADDVLPFKKEVEYDYIVQDGSHMMVVDRAEEISKVINRELEKL